MLFEIFIRRIEAFPPKEMEGKYSHRKHKKKVNTGNIPRKRKYIHLFKEVKSGQNYHHNHEKKDQKQSNYQISFPY